MNRERKPDWRNDLADLIEESRARPFEWSKHDCGLWASTAIRIVTLDDYDPAAPMRGKYKDIRGCRREIKKLFGVNTVLEVAEKVIGPRQHVAFARAGDIVSADLKRLGIANGPGILGLSLGVCYGARSFFVGETAEQVGLIELDTLSLDYAHHV